MSPELKIIPQQGNHLSSKGDFLTKSEEGSQMQNTYFCKGTGSD